MRVLLLADADFTGRERSMLDRLAIGIADDGAYVALATPAHFGDGDSTSLIQHVGYEPPPPLLGARAQAEALNERMMDRRIVGETSPFDVVHAFGRGCWALALELARLHNAAIVFEVWTLGLTPEIPKWERRARRNPWPAEVLWSAPGTALQTRMQDSATAPVQLAPWGVHAPRDSSSEAIQTHPLGIVVIANPRMSAETIAVSQALAAIGNAVRREFLIVFDDAVIRRDHRVWRRLMKAGLLDRLSIVSGLEARREPVLNADVVIAITAPGEHRSVVLDAMAHARTVVTAQDAMCDWIRDGETCLAIADYDSERWKTALIELLNDEGRRMDLGRKAQSWARAHHTVSAQVRDALNAYERVVHPAVEERTQPSAP